MRTMGDHATGVVRTAHPTSSSMPGPTRRVGAYSLSPKSPIRPMMIR